MATCEPMFWGKTFDDFLFEPLYSGVISRNEKYVSIEMPFCREIFLKGIPVISANMDTVTGEVMTRTMSEEGGMAFVPRSFPIEKQIKIIRDTKKHRSFIIEHPLKLHQDATISEAKALIRKNGKSGILVEKTRDSDILAGVLSGRDIPQDATDDSKPIKTFMTPLEKLHTAPPSIDIGEAERIMMQNRIEKLPLVDQSGKIKGLRTMKDILAAKQRPYSTKDKKGRLIVGATIGATSDFLEKAEELIKTGADCILIDLSHFHSIHGQNATVSFRKKFPDFPLIGGNIGTAQAAIDAADWGVDAVKVGIGPGKGCRTRLETGCGVPQFQAIRQVYLAIGNKIRVIADGGINNDKDIFMAIAFGGASSVMLGSMLAGTDEAPGIKSKNQTTGQPIKIYRGSTSPHAVIDSTDENNIDEALQTASEGQQVEIPYIGSVVDILRRVAGHLRSSISFSGETSLAAAQKKLSADPEKYLIPLSEAARIESFIRKGVSK